MSAPFHFQTSSDLVVLTGQRANTPAELAKLLETCDDGCLFHHMFAVLLGQHFVSERYANEFAHWLHTAAGEPSLAERVAAIDIRDFVTLQNLRTHLLSLFEDYFQENPGVGSRAARFPFHLCRSVGVVMPIGRVAHGFEDFAAYVQAATKRTIFYHFVEARLRLGFQSNDFSWWLETQCGRSDLAARVNRLDFYHHTLGSVRTRIAEIIASEVQAA